MDSICSMIGCRIHSASTDPAMAQPQNYQGSIEVDFFPYMEDELTEHSDNSVNCLSSFASAI
jgi:hypothetical protein